MNTILALAGFVLFLCLIVLYGYLERNERKVDELERISHDLRIEIEKLKMAQAMRMNHRALEYVENAQARTDRIRDDVKLMVEYVRSTAAGICKEADDVIADLAKAHTPTKK